MTDAPIKKGYLLRQSAFYTLLTGILALHLFCRRPGPQ
jgi:hypothetical protein